MKAVLIRDLKLDLRRGGQAIFLPAFFLLIVMLFPLGLGPDVKILQSAAPGLLMVAALLASLLPLEKLYTDDFRDGTLDLAALSNTPLTLYVAGKALAHWIIAGLPLVIISPVLAMMLGMESNLTLLFAFIPATALFVLMGQIAAALSLNARRGSVLLALLVVPLYIPVLIFGAGGIGLAQSGLDATGPVLFLWAMLAAAAPLTPLVTAKLLKMQME